MKATFAKGEYGAATPNLEASNLALQRLVEYDGAPFLSAPLRRATNDVIHLLQDAGMPMSHSLNFYDALTFMLPSSSPGWKYTQYDGATSQKQLLDHSKGVETIKRAVQQLIENDCDNINGCALKEELLPTSKISNNKLRMFFPNSIDAKVADTMANAIFDQNFANLALKTHSALGMSMTRGWWHFMIKYVLKATLDTPVLLFDYSGFDQSLPAQILEQVVEVRMHFAADPDFVWSRGNSMIYNYFVTPSGELVSKAQSNPSGGMQTLSNNCLANLIIVRYLWYCCTDESFSLHHRDVNLGDDFIATRSDFSRSVMTPELMKEHLAPTGMTLKYVEEVPLRDADFLQQFTTVYKGFFVPVASVDKAWDNLMFYTTNDPGEFLIKLNSLIHATAHNTRCHELVSFRRWFVIFCQTTYEDLSPTWREGMSSIKSLEYERDSYIYQYE